MRAAEGWRQAQTRFAKLLSDERTIGLRALLHKVAAIDLPDVPRHLRLVRAVLEQLG